MVLGTVWRSAFVTKQANAPDADSLSSQPASQMLELLAAVAQRRHDLSLERFERAQIDWIVRSGLGPLGCAAASRAADHGISPHWPVLQAADLTARVIAGDHIDAMCEIIDASREDKIENLTLLKGISLAEECYPEFHLRPMRDIDVLVPPGAVPRLERVLRTLGYRQSSTAPAVYQTHHHTAPFHHVEKDIWIEVHHHLVSAKNRGCQDPVFQLSNVMAQSRRSRFQGRDVCRLGAELELVYLAAHWAQDFKTVGAMIAAIDVIQLLNHHGDRLRWPLILNWLESSVTASYLFLLLTYLDRRRLIDLPTAVLVRLGEFQRLGSWSVKAAHILMDRYMLEGNSFGALLSRRNLSVAWQTLCVPLPAPCKLLLLPLNLCMPIHYRIQ